MLIKQDAGLPRSIKKAYTAFFLSLCMGLASQCNSLYGVNPEPETITYHLNIADFTNSFIEIPTSNLSGSSSTVSSNYTAGLAPIYDVNDTIVGTCSASFLSIQNVAGIYTEIANSLSATNGLIVNWSTPATLVDMTLATQIDAMVTECTVVATSQVNATPFVGQTFVLTVSSDGTYLYFQFARTGMIF